MHLDAFKEFLVLAATKNYGEAADRLYISQSALTKHIQQMEKELGVQLFSRNSRKVTLTEFGQILLPFAARMRDTEVEYKEKIAQKQAEKDGWIILSTIHSMAEYKITDLIGGFQLAYPEYLITIKEEDHPKQMVRLQQNQCNMAFFREKEEGQERDSDLEKIPYVEDTMVALLPGKHPLAGERYLKLTDLKEEKFAFLKSNTTMHKITMEACLRAGFMPQVILDSDRLANIFEAVKRGLCVALVMRQHVQSLVQENPDFVVAEITPPIKAMIYLGYRKYDQLSDAATCFVHYVKKQKKLLFPEQTL